MHLSENFTAFQDDLLQSSLEIFGVGASKLVFLELNIDPQDATLEVRRYIGDSKSVRISKTWCLYVTRNRYGELSIDADNRELQDLSYGPALTDDAIRLRAQSVALPFTPACLKDLRVSEGTDAFCLDFVLGGLPDECSEEQIVRIDLRVDSCVVLSNSLTPVPGEFFTRSALSPIEIAALARIVWAHRAFADKTSENELRQFREQLAAWVAVPLWIGKRTVPVGEQIKVLFTEGEKSCTERRFARPDRDGSAHALSTEKNATPAWQYEPATLGELISTRRGIQALYRRLDEDCVALYGEADAVFAESRSEGFAFQTVWAWENQVSSATALLCAPMQDVANGPCGEFPIVIPSAWGRLCSFQLGGLRLHKGNTVVVSNAEGLCGVVRLRQLSEAPVRVVGEWVQPCTWSYLSGGLYTASNFLEAATTTEPDARGELVCDLIDPLDGRRINPPGVKGLMGTCDYAGAIVVNEAGQGRYPRVLGKLDMQGILSCGQPMEDLQLTDVEWGVDDLQWLEIGTRSEGFTAVRSPENSLYGYVDRAGALAIPAQFADVRRFDKGRAAAILPGSVFWGLIDTTGEWVVLPKWRDLEDWETDLIVVEDAKHRWGAVDGRGKAIVEFKSQAEWLLNPVTALLLLEYQSGNAWANNEQGMLRDVVISGIRKIANEQLRRRGREAFKACVGSLSGMEGVFNASSSERDLMESGLWGKQVRLLNDKTDGILQPVKGEMGRIGCYYPVSLSCFDLSIEVPVNDLPTQPNAAIGIRWRDLALVDTESAEQIPAQPSAWEKLKQAATKTTDISAHLVGSLFLLIRMGIVGIALHVILNGIYHVPLVSALPGLLCGGYLLWVGWKVAQALLAQETQQASEVFVTAYADSQRFFWWNFGGFVVWFLLVLGFKGQVDPWFAPIWAVLSSLNVLRMAQRIAASPHPQQNLIGLLMSLIRGQ